ncbi:MAG: DUF262 domain-containing protein [Peptostreptococcaceae bacterium]
MAKTNKKILTEEQILENSLNRLRDEYYHMPTPPTRRRLSVGDKVRIGNLKDCIVEEVLEDGKILLINYTKIDNNYGKPIENKNQRGYWCWMDTLPLNNLISEDIFSVKDDIRIFYSQRQMYGLFTHAYHFGFDLNPSYQRGNVWGLEEKVLLIESIFNNIDIGKFTFVKPDSILEPTEVLDGKQRITTLLEFYEDRFQYKGKYFSELNWKDQNHITSYSINWGETSGLTEQQKIKYFLKLNTCGKPMDKEHLDSVRSMLKD